MAMVAGTVTVNPDGTYTGSGLAKRMMDAHFPGELAQFPTASQAGVAPGLAAFCARLAIAYAGAIVAEIQANAVARVTTQSTGRIPSSVVAGTPIDAPSAEVDLPIQ